MLTFLLHVLGWYLIGVLFIASACLFDYFKGDPNEKVTLDLLGVMAAVALLGPLAIVIPIIFMWDYYVKKWLKGRSAKDIVLYQPRGPKK